MTVLPYATSPAPHRWRRRLNRLLIPLAVIAVLVAVGERFFVRSRVVVMDMETGTRRVEQRYCGIPLPATTVTSPFAQRLTRLNLTWQPKWKEVQWTATPS